MTLDSVAILNTSGGIPLGSGIKLNESLVVTADHVVSRSDQCFVLDADGEEATGTVIRRLNRESLDVALILLAQPLAAPDISISKVGRQHVTLPFIATGWPTGRAFRAHPASIGGYIANSDARIFSNQPAIQLYCHEVAASLNPHGMSGAAISIVQTDSAPTAIGVIRWGPEDGAGRFPGGVLYATPLTLALEALSVGLREDLRVQLMAWRHTTTLDVRAPLDSGIRQPAVVSRRRRDTQGSSPWTAGSLRTGQAFDDVFDAVQPHLQRTLVIGSAGMGKSTLLSRIALVASDTPQVIDLARREVGSADAGKRPRLDEISGDPSTAVIVDSLDRAPVGREQIGQRLAGSARWVVAGRKLADIPLELRQMANIVIQLYPLSESHSRSMLARWIGPDAADATYPRLSAMTTNRTQSVCSIPMLLRLAAQAGPGPTSSIRAFMDHCLIQLLGPSGVQADLRSPSGLVGVLNSLETLAFRLTSKNRTYIDSAKTHSGELTIASQARIIELDSLTGFVHALWQEHFASRHLLRSMMEGRSFEEFAGSTPWWIASPWDEALDGIVQDEPARVARWLAAWRPRDSLLIAPELRAEPELLRGVKRAVKLARQDGSVAARVAAVELGDFAAESDRLGVGCRDDRLPKFKWSAPSGGQYLSAYPVTVGQLNAFRDATGKSPELVDSNVESALGKTLPAVRVAWYEAVAFCEWVSSGMNECIRLPTVDEWMRFAAVDGAGPYPFGEWRQGIANTRSSKLTCASPVGAFADGDTSSGVSDLCGNVWEWCAGNDSETLLAPVKGGSWASYTHHCSIVAVNLLSKVGEFDDVGFRVLLDSR